VNTSDPNQHSIPLFYGGIDALWTYIYSRILREDLSRCKSRPGIFVFFHALNLQSAFKLSYVIRIIPLLFRTTAYLLIMDDVTFLESLSLVTCQPFQIYTQDQTIVQLTAIQPVFLETPFSKGRRRVSCVLDFVRCTCEYDYFVTNKKWNYLVVLY
jgi:hypothetical protein